MTTPTVSTAGLLTRAASFAAIKHCAQRRKDVDATPYINHTLAVAAILSEEGGVDDAEILAAAILHDTVEDTEATLDELTKLFGKRVASIVGEVTDDMTLPKAERKAKQISSAAGKRREAKLVKLADKISNLRDIARTPPANWSLTRRQEYFDFAAEVVKGLTGENQALDTAFTLAYEARPK
ncbi:MAG: bifunctional (p)ppGpp synthetase/guanosine-3',5'-bis(diphosphate) 3'-pyrophosphohydrolase [Sphingomonadales bacterium]|nr:bifunctional (p)ppGpp synthetase/guanosine-3',5'-bis(diphosphate) 3'-pyrophosphohydrolase [Sphingomonadales bacterium]